MYHFHDVTGSILLLLGLLIIIFKPERSMWLRNKVQQFTWTDIFLLFLIYTVSYGVFYVLLLLSFSKPKKTLD